MTLLLWYYTQIEEMPEEWHEQEGNNYTWCSTIQHLNNLTDEEFSAIEHHNGFHNT